MHVFVDFTKAFDSTNCNRMYLILAAYGISCAISNVIRCVYTNWKSFVSTQDGDTEAFAVNTGVLQGDTLAPFYLLLFLTMLSAKLCATQSLELH